MAAQANVNIYLKLFDQALKPFLSSVRSMKSELKQLQDISRQTNAMQAQMSKAFGNSAVSTKKLSAEAKTLSAASQQMALPLNFAAKSATNMGKQFNEAKSIANNFRSAMSTAGNFIQGAATRMFGAISGGVKSLENARRGFSRMSSSIEAAGGRMNVLGQRLTFFIGLPIALFFKSIIQEGVAWDRQLVNLSRVTGLSADETETLGKSVLDLGATLPITREALGEIALNAGKAGIGFDKLQEAQEAAKSGNEELANQLKSEASSEILKFTRISALATVAMTDFEGSGDEVSKRLIQLGAIFKVPTEQLENFGSAVDTVADASNISSKDIVDTLSRISNARLFDMPAQDAIAFAATMTEITQVATRTGTEFNSSFKFLADNIEDAAAVAGMSKETFKDLFDTNATDAVLAFATGLSKVESNTEQVTLANNILGQVGAKAILPLMENISRFNTLQKLSNSSWEENTRLVKEAARQSNSIGGQWDILVFGLNRLKLSIFDTFKGSLVPILREANILVADFMSWFDKLDGSQKQKLILIASAIGSILLVGGPLLILFGLMLQGIGSIGTALAFLVGPIGFPALALALSGAYLLFNQVISSVFILGGGWKGLAGTAVLIANAFGLINDSKTDEFLGKLGLKTDETTDKVEAAKKKIEEWKKKIFDIRDAIIKFKDKVIELKDKMVEWFNEVDKKYHIIEKLQKVFWTIVGIIQNNVIPQFQKLGKVFEDNGPQIKLVAEIIGGVLVAALLGAIGVMLGMASAAAKAISGVVKIFGGLVSFFQGTWELIKDIFTGNFQDISDDLNNIGNSLATIFEGTLDLVIGTVLNFTTTIYDYFKGLYDDLIGHSIIPDMVDGIVDEFGRLADEALNMGKNIVQGLINGVTSLASSAKDAAVNMATNFINSANETFDNHSPSKVFEQMGKFNIQGLINGTESMADELNTSMAQLGTDAAKEIAKSLYDKQQDILKAQNQLNAELKKSDKTRNQDTINSLTQEINDGKRFMDQHKADYIKYSKEINRVALRASHDNVDILKDELKDKQDLLRSNTIADLTKKLVDKVREAGTGFSDAFDAFTTANKTARDAFDKTSLEITTKMETVRTSLATTLDNINKDFKIKTAEIKKSFNDAMAGLSTDFANNVANEIINAQNSIGDNQGKIAKEIVTAQDSLAGHQEELAQLQSATNSKDNSDKIKELQDTIAQEEAYLAKHNDYVSLLQSQITEIRRVNSLDAIDVIAEQIQKEQEFLNNHVKDQQNYAAQIAEINRKSSLDSIQILQEQFNQQRSALQIKLAEDLAANELARQTEITNAKAAADVELANLQLELVAAQGTLDTALALSQKTFEDTSKAIRKTFKSAFEGIQDVINSLNADGLAKNFKRAIKAINTFIKEQNATGNFKLKLLDADKFATGGIVPGSFSQAKMVQAHGSEMILNPGQQANLFNLINGGGTLQSSSPISSSSSGSQKIEIHNHYEYSPKVGAMIATEGEQRDFLRNMNRLQAQENLRYGINPKLAFQ